MIVVVHSHITIGHRILFFASNREDPYLTLNDPGFIPVDFNHFGLVGQLINLRMGSDDDQNSAWYATRHSWPTVGLSVWAVGSVIRIRRIGYKAFIYQDDSLFRNSNLVLIESKRSCPQYAIDFNESRYLQASKQSSSSRRPSSVPRRRICPASH